MSILSLGYWLAVVLTCCCTGLLLYYLTVVLFFCFTILIYMQPCFIYGLVLLYRLAVAVPSAQQFSLFGHLEHSSVGKYHKKQEEHRVIGKELHTKASSQHPKEGRHNQGSHIG